MTTASEGRRRVLHRAHGLGWALALSVATGAAAQTRLALEPSAGVAIPLAELDNLAEPGFTVSGAATWFFHPNVGVRGQVQGEFLNDRVDPLGVVPAPPLTLVHLIGGVEVDFVPSRYQNQPLTFRINLGAGITSVSGNASYADGSSIDFSESYPSFSGGAQVGYRIDSRLELFGGATVHLMLFDEADTEVFSDRSRQVDPFSEGWSLPVTAGVRISI